MYIYIYLYIYLYNLYIYIYIIYIYRKAHEQIAYKIEAMNGRIDGMMIKHKKKANPDITDALAKVLKKGENRQRMLALAQVYTNAGDRLQEWDFDMIKKHDRNLVDGRTYRGRVRNYQYMSKQLKKLFMMTKLEDPVKHTQCLIEK